MSDPSRIASASLASLPLLGRVAVVTGASSGIGRATALRLASAGADLLVHCRSRRPLAEETAAAAREMGRAAQVAAADLCCPEACDSLVDQAWRWQGQVSIWVNNAGADVLTGDAAQWDFERKLEAIWSVDVRATMRLSRLAGARMFADSQSRSAGCTPVIINTGWDQAAWGMAGDSGELFAASKGAVMGFTRSLAKTLAPRVRVNCVAPGWIRTAWGDGAPEYWQQRAMRESLLNRWGTPEDVAEATTYLAGAEFCTGVVLPVNGGFREPSTMGDMRAV